MLRLAGQLLSLPGSRYRAIKVLGGIEYIGWDTSQYTLAGMYNLIAGLAYGLGGKDVPEDRLHPVPKGTADEQAPKLVAPSIAEFSIPQFFERMNS